MISILDDGAGCEGYSVLAEQHMACLRLDASCKQGLMSPLEELRPDRVVGLRQTSQQQCASPSQKEEEEVSVNISDIKRLLHKMFFTLSIYLSVCSSRCYIPSSNRSLRDTPTGSGSCNWSS